MNSFGLWIFGQVVKGATQRAIGALFNESLLARLLSTAERWRVGLAEGEGLLSIDALLPRVAPGLQPPPAPIQLFAKLESHQLPDADDWTDALVEQWKWVRTTIDEPQV